MKKQQGFRITFKTKEYPELEQHMDHHYFDYPEELTKEEVKNDFKDGGLKSPAIKGNTLLKIISVIRVF